MSSNVQLDRIESVSRSHANRSTTDADSRQCRAKHASMCTVDRPATQTDDSTRTGVSRLARCPSGSTHSHPSTVVRVISLDVWSRAVAVLTRVPDGELEFCASEGEHLDLQVDSHRVSHVALEVARGEAQQDRRLADTTVADLTAVKDRRSGSGSDRRERRPREAASGADGERPSDSSSVVATPARCEHSSVMITLKDPCMRFARTRMQCHCQRTPLEPREGSASAQASGTRSSICPLQLAVSAAARRTSSSLNRWSYVSVMATREFGKGVGGVGAAGSRNG